VKDLGDLFTIQPSFIYLNKWHTDHEAVLYVTEYLSVNWVSHMVGHITTLSGTAHEPYLLNTLPHFVYSDVYYE
jgi:hypothetical protein